MQHIPKPYIDSDAEHSEYSPSGSKRWISCPASINLIRKLNRPQGGSNFYAEEGTAAHELAAYCLDEELNADSQIGKVFNKFTVDRDMATQTQKYVDYVNGQVTWESTLWVENRLSLESVGPDIFGTADAIIVSKDSLEVIDLKYGRGVVVEADNNTQLMLYAVGALDHLRKHGIEFDPGFDVKVTIVQPRAPHSNGPIRSDWVTVAQLDDVARIAKEAVISSQSDNAKFGPTEDGCRWCEAAPMCRANAEHNLELAKLEFADFAQPPREFKQSMVTAAELSMDEISSILKHAKAIEQWVKNIAEFAVEQMKAEKPIPGYKLVYGRSNRAWDDSDEVFKKLMEYGTDEERIMKSKMLTVAQMEKELTDDEWELVKELVIKPRGNVTLALETDKRMAINNTAEAVDEWGNEDL